MNNHEISEINEKLRTGGTTFVSGNLGSRISPFVYFAYFVVPNLRV